MKQHILITACDLHAFNSSEVDFTAFPCSLCSKNTLAWVGAKQLEDLPLSCQDCFGDLQSCRCIIFQCPCDNSSDCVNEAVAVCMASAICALKLQVSTGLYLYT